MEASEVLRTSFKPVSHSQTAPPPNTAQQSTALPSLSNSVTKSPDSVPSKGYSTSLYGRPSHPESTRVLNVRRIVSNDIPAITELRNSLLYLASQHNVRINRSRARKTISRIKVSCREGMCSFGISGSIPLAEPPSRDFHRRGSTREQSVHIRAYHSPTNKNLHERLRLHQFHQPREPRLGAHPNSNTAVRSSLEIRQAHVDAFDSEPRDESSIALLSDTLLRPDLPAGNKDLLVLMVADYGDVIRYS